MRSKWGRAFLSSLSLYNNSPPPLVLPTQLPLIILISECRHAFWMLLQPFWLERGVGKCHAGEIYSMAISYDGWTESPYM